MEQRQYLIDSNAIVDYLSAKLPVSGIDFMNRVVNAIPNISIITKIEVLSFNTLDEYYQLLTNFINDSTIFHLTDDIVVTTISIRRENKIKLPDAIIAATARVYDLFLITRNINDFRKIPGLHIMDSYSL